MTSLHFPRPQAGIAWPGILLWLAVIGLIAFVLYQNWHTVPVNLLFWTLIALPLPALLLGAMAVGILLWEALRLMLRRRRAVPPLPPRPRYSPDSSPR